MVNDLQDRKLKVGIIGANGYSGLELIRLLEHHPFAEVKMLMSHSTGGMNIKDIAPHLKGIYECPLEKVNVDVVSARIECLFFATPAGISQTLIPEFLAKGVICIDLSGDFRLRDGDTYEAWYQRKSASDEFLKQAVYGLPEIFGRDIKNAKLVANPGCYPTATLLGLLPALHKGDIDPNTIIIDGKSGVSGSGRSPTASTHFCEVNENISAYKVGMHQHIPEIEQVITQVLGEAVTVTFSTHLIPLTRGLMCTMYAQLNHEITTEELVESYQAFYKPHPFIRVCEPGCFPTTKQVFGSNYCDIGLYSDRRTQRLMVVSVIDNVVKGASGQAIQNMNLIQGWDETTGLTFVPVYP